MSCLVHGDSSGAGGSLFSGHGGHSSRLPPCRRYGGGRWGTLWGPLTPGHARRKPQPPSQPRMASGSCGLSCPVCLAFLSCFVLSCCVFSPGGLLIPPNFPREILWGDIRVPAVGAGPRGPRPRPPKTICHGLQSSQLRHGLQSSSSHGLQLHGLQSCQLRHGLRIVCSALEVPVLCSCPCLSWGASRAPAHPPSPMELLRLGTSLSGGGSYVSPLSCVSCVPASCFLIWFVSCPR